jgi:competence protein ComEA
MDLSPPAGAFPSGGTSSGSDRAVGERPPLDLNSATAAELERLPHIGAHLAGVIVAFRDKYGRFPVVDSLTRVPGIGPATVNRLRGLVRAE